MTLDAKFRWKPHVKKKREELGLRYKRIYWLIGRVSSLSLHNKLLLYKQILKPYGHTVSKSGIAPNKVTETLYYDPRTKFYGTLSMHPWYSRNIDLHRDLEMDVVSSEIQICTKTRRKPPSSWESIGHTAPGHGHSAQTPGQKLPVELV